MASQCWSRSMPYSPPALVATTLAIGPGINYCTNLFERTENNTPKSTQYCIFTIIRQVGKQLTLFSNVNNQLLIISWYCRWQTEDDYHYRRSLRALANDWETFKSKWSWQHGETSFKIRLLRKDHSRCLPWLFLGSCRPKTNDSLVYNKSKWQNRSNHGPKDWHNDTNQSQVRTNHVRCFCSRWPRIKVVPAGTAGFIAESNSFRLASKHTGVANLFKLRPLRKGRGPSPIFNRSFST